MFFGDEFIDRINEIKTDIPKTKQMFFCGRHCPDWAEDGIDLSYFCSESLPPVMLKKEDEAVIYFSSGTTGFPKAILHKHSSLVASCKIECDNHHQNRDDVFLCIPPLYHTGAKMH